MTETLGIRRKPRVIQLPVTSRCNSRCVTCNIWKHKENNDIDPIKLKEVFKDPYFNKVTSVGMNGGEITLISNFNEILEAVLTLPSLKWIYLISNGLLPEKLFTLLKAAKRIANSKGIKISLQLSVDGIGIIHEKTRGIPNCFARTQKILKEMEENKQDYYDDFSVGCTISQSNVASLRQVVSYFENKKISVYYHLAVPNKRIHTFNDSEKYYVFNDERSKLLAMEFFYERMCLTPKSQIYKKFGYFATYYFLKNNGHGRLTSCQYRLRDLTIDENLNLYLCATASDSFGNLNEQGATEAIKTINCSNELKKVRNICDDCIHYAGLPTIKGLWEFFKYNIRNRTKIWQFK